MNFALISHVWNVIVESNIFNFTIFVLIFVWIFKKINVKGMIATLQRKIIEVLDEAKKTKEEAKNELVNAEKAIENLDTELSAIVSDAKNSAEVISKKILTEAEKQIENIDLNAKKIIDAEEKMLVSKLTKNASKASVEVAKSHIKDVLSQTPSLHEKYIDESINELDRLNF